LDTKAVETGDNRAIQIATRSAKREQTRRNLRIVTMGKCRTFDALVIVMFMPA
jgi:hypothetical protein